MKKIIIIFLVPFIFGCNNNTGSTSETTQKDSVKNSEAKLEEKTGNLVAGPCGKLIFFHPGAQIEATSYDEDGKATSKQLTKILSVTNDGGFTVANVEGIDSVFGDPGKTTVNYNYKCDGKKIYFDVASMFRTAEKEEDASFESSLIEYPVNLKEGEVLPDATGKMSSEREGKKSTMKYIYKDRKVEGREDVTTPAGTWNCYKISNTIEVEMDIPGMDEKSKEMMKQMRESMKNTTTTWFSPDFGIVKMEMYMNGKLQSKNEVTGVKKL